MRRGGKRARTDAGATRLRRARAALRAALQSLVVSVADRAAEQVARVWRDNPGGAALIAAAEASRARDERAKREFESAFGDLARRTSPPVKQGAFDRSSADLPLRVSRAVSAWQDQLMRLIARPARNHPRRVRRKGNRNRCSRPARASGGPVSVITLVAMLGQPSQPARRPASPWRRRRRRARARTRSARVPRRLLASLVGSAESAALLARARQDLNQRVGLLLDEELLRFGEVIDEVGPVDAVAAVRLYQAEYSLEAAR